MYITEFFDKLILACTHLTGGTCVIAGGAVRDLLYGKRIKDYDVFTINDKNWLDPAESINAYKEIFSKTVTLKESKLYSKQLFHTQTFRIGSKTFQVIYNKAASVEELLDSFDWNICQFAYTGNGNFVNQERRWEITELKLHKLATIVHPKLTLKRGKRFAKKFNMEIDPVSLKFLDGLISGIIEI